jgi:hypothetical protein
MRINSSGNLGVGTSSPSKLLTIGSSTTANPTVRINGSLTGGSDTYQYSFGLDDTADFAGIKLNYADRVSKGLQIFTAPGFSFPITFYTNSATQAMTLDISGNLGIGSTSPTAKLDISGISTTQNGLRLTATSGGQALAAFTADTSTGEIRIGGTVAAAGNYFPVFYAAGSERARITSGGYFKASDDGVYAGSANTWHEFNQSANSLGLAVVVDNASLTSSVVEISAARNTTNNSYYFLDCAVGGVAYRFRVADSGAIATAGSISLGTVTPATSGIGVQFPATQSASTDANTLDDYEEGTIDGTTLGLAYTTPGTSSITYSDRRGTYTKIGRIVYFTLDIRLASFSKGTASGTLTVFGLPFTQRNTGGFDGARCTVQLYEWTYTTSPIIAAVASAGTYILITRMVSNAVTADIDDPKASSIIWVTGFYFV